MKMKPLAFWKIIYDLATLKDRHPAYQQAASAAGKKMIINSPRTDYRGLPFQLDWTFASIWISRYWTAEETANTLLEESDFGANSPGIAGAAKWYFETELDSLSNEEVVFLACISKAPKVYDPWRSPDRAKLRLRYCLKKVSLSGEYPVTLDPESALKRLVERLPYQGRTPPTP